MSRSQQEAISKQSAAQGTQLMGNANTALGGVNSGLTDFNSRLNKYYADDPFKRGGEFQTTQNTIAQGRANANASALKSELDLNSLRTGENTAGYANTLASAQRQGTLDAADAEAKANADRLKEETRYQSYGLEASKFPVQTQEGIYSGSVGGSNAALNTAGQNAKAPGFWDWFMENAQQGAKTGAAIAAA